METENPYLSPVVSGKGEYDWTLAKRVFVAVSMLVFVYLMAGAVGSWQSYSRLNGVKQNTPLEQARAFFTDWKAERGLPVTP